MSTDAKQGKWHSAWCPFFQSLLDERKLTHSDFAVLSGNRQNNIWRYANGEVRPPLKALAHWAQRLHLDEGEREKFIRLAKLAYAPPEVRDEVNRLRAEVAAARAELANIKRLLGDLGVDLSGLRA